MGLWARALAMKETVGLGLSNPFIKRIVGRVYAEVDQLKSNPTALASH